MTLRIALSVLEILALVAVLAYFLRRIGTLLTNVVGNLETVAAGVAAVEGHCGRIGPNVVELNGLLADSAAGLEGAAGETEALAR